MKHEPFIAGVDEAGRGPVIGPMVLGIVACKDQEVVRRLGMKDSKLLTPQKRKELSITLCEMKHDIFYESIALSPADIDVAVNDRRDNLNKLEARATAQLIYKLAQRVSLHTVIIDSPTRTTFNHERDVREALNKIDKKGITKEIKLQAEIKADLHHPVVGAASIIAKVARDEAIEKLSEIYGPMGSGYAADPKTQKFLQERWHEAHDFFRKSWSTYSRLAHKESGQKSLVDFGAQQEHVSVIKTFEKLVEHGYYFIAPTNQYEIVRMKHDDGMTLIVYSTGKIVVQGSDTERKKTEELMQTLGLTDIAKHMQKKKR